MVGVWPVRANVRHIQRSDGKETTREIEDLDSLRRRGVGWGAAVVGVAL